MTLLFYDSLMRSSLHSKVQSWMQKLQNTDDSLLGISQNSNTLFKILFIVGQIFLLLKYYYFLVACAITFITKTGEYNR